MRAYEMVKTYATFLGRHRRIFYTVSQKNDIKLLLIIPQMLNDFHNSFTDRLCATKAYLNIPSHLQYVTL